MASPFNPEEPPPHSPGRSPGLREHDESTEIFGRIELTRHVKDDGRALILYTPRKADDETEARRA
jgi:hypothetical protein